MDSTTALTNSQEGFEPMSILYQNRVINYYAQKWK